MTTNKVKHILTGDRRKKYGGSFQQPHLKVPQKKLSLITHTDVPSVKSSVSEVTASTTSWGRLANALSVGAKTVNTSVARASPRPAATTKSQSVANPSVVQAISAIT